LPASVAGSCLLLGLYGADFVHVFVLCFSKVLCF